MQQQFETTTTEETSVTFAPVPTITEPLTPVVAPSNETRTEAQPLAQSAAGMTLETLLPRLKRLALREKRRRYLREAARKAIIIALWLWFFRKVEFGWMLFLYSAFFGWVSNAVVTTTLGPFLHFRRNADQRLVRELAKIEDVRAVGPLAEALELKGNDLRKIVIAALMGLLPRLTASDSALISPEQRGYLYRALDTMNADFVLALLKGLEQVGDAKAIPYVEKLAAGKRSAKISKKVQDEAKVCLEFLRQRAPHQEANETLLRAAASQSAAPNTLLRPAASNPETPSQQLLRAANADSQETESP